ncbi:putative sodium-dependent multivitamin transporter isoform X2 [Nomia melanderi]|uniref:putative sodium-dependent multivitamin transporter isoform X2 n=1 Tax=Nomia melanderi TaxID=2448451 RepID=UPI003FCD6796
MSDSTAGASTLQWPDYLVIGVMLLISTVIGIYYRFSGGRQRTMEEYFSADRSIGLFTLSMGLSVSFVSGVSMLGFSSEVYTNGILFLTLQFGYMLALPLIIKCYLPVFIKSNTMSIYEYLEKRFGPRARVLTSVINTVLLTMYTSIAIFAPALAIEATAGLSGHMSILLIGGICTFYSTLGGIKAVLITDVIQAILMLAGLVCAIAIAIVNIDGGLYGAWDAAARSGRLNFSDFSFDPTIRHTTWNLLLGSMLMNLQLYGVSQVQVQRYLSAKNLKTASYSLMICGGLTSTMLTLSCFCGWLLYAVYKDCDPVLSGKISSFDKILPFFAAEKMTEYPGTSGLLISAIFSATLSTISATMNSLAVVTLEDYLKPLWSKFGVEMSEERATMIGKILALGFGAICVSLAFACRSLGALINITLNLFGLLGGPVVGIFTLGMFVEAANEFGAIIGQMSVVIPLALIARGTTDDIASLPLSIEGCDNSTLISVQNFTTSADDLEMPYMSRISHMLYLPIGTFVTISTGYLASLIINKVYPSARRIPDPDLFTPFLARRIKRRRQDANKTTTSQLYMMETRG